MCMKNNPYVSIVVCIYNGEKTLQSAIDSLLEQDYPKDKYEIVLVNDGSSDRSAKICREFLKKYEGTYPKITYVFQENGGLSIARNAGISLAKGDIIAFIDQDAVADVHWIEEMTKPFYNDNADFVGGKIELLNTGSKVAQLIQLARFKQLFGPKVFLNEIIGCNMAYRREIFECFGGFYENFTSRGDESSLLERIKGTFQYRPVANAIVYHEQPESIIVFIKNEWKSSTLSGLTGKVSNKISLRVIAARIEHGFISILPLALFGSFLYKPIWILTLLALVAFCRRLFIRTANRKTFVDLISYYGRVKGFAIHIMFVYLMSSIAFSGNIAGFFKYRKAFLGHPIAGDMDKS